MITRTTSRRVVAGLGIAAFLSMGALTACGGGESGGPSSTTPTTSTSTPSVSPTEKGLDPTGGNKFSPTVKAPPPATAIPGTHNN